MKAISKEQFVYKLNTLNMGNISKGTSKYLKTLKNSDSIDFEALSKDTKESVSGFFQGELSKDNLNPEVLEALMKYHIEFGISELDDLSQ